MYFVIVSIIMFICVLMALVVLVQNPKGGGIASGASSANNIMGVQRTGDLLEKITWGLAVAMVVLVLSSNFFIDRNGSGAEIRSVNAEKAQEVMPSQPAAPAASTPAPAPEEQPAQQNPAEIPAE